MLDKITKAEVWVASGRGEPKKIAISKGENGLQGELDAASNQSTVFLKHDYGVMSKGSDPFLLRYYAKVYPSVLPGTWKSVADTQRLPLEVTPLRDGKKVAFQVRWDGQPLPGSTVTIVGPGIDKKIEGTTDDAGKFVAELPQGGLFSIRARHTQETAGKFEDKEYKSVRHYSTLTLNYQPARLSPTANSLPEMPKGVTSFGGAIVNNSLYVYGGNYGGAHEYVKEDQSNDLWKLDLANPTKWEVVSQGPRLQGLSLVEFKGQLYRVGGFSATNQNGEKANLVSSAEFARFDPASGKWTELPALPEPRSSHDAVVIGDRLYVAGGWNMQGGGQGAKWHETIQVYHLAAEKGEWTAISAPFKRRALSVANWNGKLVCLGGMTEKAGPTTSTSIFDPATNAWTDGKALQGGPMDGFGTSSFAMRGSVIVTTMTGSIQALNAENGKWDYLGQIDHSRFFHRLLPWQGDKLVVVGGADMEEGKALQLEVLQLNDLQLTAR